jgi:F0F1-type ATP synthase alpha subunit
MYLAGTKVHLQANKNLDYQSSVLIMFEALAKFITEHDYAVVNLAERFRENEGDFVISSDDLTEQGMSWAKNHLDKWMGRMDRRKSPPSIESYILALEKTVP